MCWACRSPAIRSPVAGVPQLWVAQVDTRGRFEQSWSHIRGYLVGVLAARGMAEVQAEELTVLPGAEEIVALLELRRLAESGEFDVIVVDCAPTGETLRLLALPETIGFYAQRLIGAPQRVLRSIAASLTGLPGAVPERHRPGRARRAAGRADGGPGVAGRSGDHRGAAGADPGADGGGGGPAAVHRAVAARLPRSRRSSSTGCCPPKVGGEFLRRQREGQREAMTQVAESFDGLSIRRCR